MTSTKLARINLHRRHLDESQRGMVAARVATLRKGDNQHTPIGASSQSDAATALNVGHRTVQRARSVLDKGVPELVSAVDREEAACPEEVTP